MGGLRQGKNVCNFYGASFGGDVLDAICIYLFKATVFLLYLIDIHFWAFLVLKIIMKRNIWSSGFIPVKRLNSKEREICVQKRHIYLQNRKGLTRAARRDLWLKISNTRNSGERSKEVKSGATMKYSSRSNNGESSNALQINATETKPRGK
jgi:hypothetical protein